MGGAGAADTTVEAMLGADATGTVVVRGEVGSILGGEGEAQLASVSAMQTAEGFTRTKIARIVDFTLDFDDICKERTSPHCFFHTSLPEQFPHVKKSVPLMAVI